MMIFGRKLVPYLRCVWFSSKCRVGPRESQNCALGWIPVSSKLYLKEWGPSKQSQSQIRSCKELMYFWFLLCLWGRSICFIHHWEVCTELPNNSLQLHSGDWQDLQSESSSNIVAFEVRGLPDLLPWFPGNTESKGSEAEDQWVGGGRK